MTRRRKHKAIVEKPSTNVQEVPVSKTFACSLVPYLPPDIIDCLFDIIEAQEGTGRIKSSALPQWTQVSAHEQRFWVVLSLVCKSWAKLAVKHRKTVILPTPRALKRFVAHCARLQAKGNRFSVLHLRTTNITDDDLSPLYPLLADSIDSLSIPFNLLKTKLVNMIGKSGEYQIRRLLICGDLSVRADVGRAGRWWPQFHAFHRHPSLVELSLRNIAIKGRFEPFQASIESPIEAIHLESVSLYDGASEQYFASALHHVRYIHMDQTTSASHMFINLWAQNSRLEHLHLDGRFLEKILMSAEDTAMQRLRKINSISVENPGSHRISRDYLWSGEVEEIAFSRTTPKIARGYLEDFSHPDVMPNLRTFPNIALVPGLHPASVRAELPVGVLKESLSELKRRGIVFGQAEIAGTVWDRLEM